MPLYNTTKSILPTKVKGFLSFGQNKTTQPTAAQSGSGPLDPSTPSKSPFISPSSPDKGVYSSLFPNQNPAANTIRQVSQPDPAALPQVKGMLGTNSPQVSTQTASTVPITRAPIPTPQSEFTPEQPKVTRASIPAPEVQEDKPTNDPPIVRAANPEPQTKYTPPEAPKEDDLATLREYAKNALLAKEDPAAIKAFNNAIVNFGIQSQVQRDLLQQQINADPQLRGQGAGTALLSWMAIQNGAQYSDLAIQLGEKAADRVRDLNQWGFDKLSGILEYKDGKAANIRQELLNAGDYDGYARQFKNDTGIDVNIADLKELSPATQNAVGNLLSLMEKAIQSGNLDHARKLFDNITKLSPKAFDGATFDELGFADDSYLNRSQTNDQIGTQIRLDVNQGNLDEARAGILRLNPDKGVRETKGRQAIDSMSLEDINKVLKDAGSSEITDKSELIGREDDFFQDKEISRIKSESGKTVVDQTVSFLSEELKKQGYDITNPELVKALRSYSLNLQLNGGLTVNSKGEVEVDPNTLIPPWDDRSVDSHLFSDWPVLDSNGNEIDKGWEPYGESNPKPPPNSGRGSYYENLDAKWEEYLMKTPSENRLTRKQWFYATNAGTTPVDEKNIPGGLKPTTPDPEPGKFTLGDRELSSLNALEWEKLVDDEALLQTLEKEGKVKILNKVPTSLRLNDFIGTGLKADKVLESTWDQQLNGGYTRKHYANAENSAGDGNGSIVILNGQPWQVIQYETIKETPYIGSDKRNGKTTIENLITGETQVIETGFKEI